MIFRSDSRQKNKIELTTSIQKLIVMKETVKIKRYLNKKLNSAKKSQKKVFISRQQKSYKIKIKTPCFGNYNY